MTIRRKLFFTLLVVLIPPAFFILLELGLRLILHGPNLDLFVAETFGGRTMTIMNPDVKKRYFSHVQFTPNTSQDYFLVPKPTGVYRIVCLGGSTTAGFPYGFGGAFASFLRDRLHAFFPNRAIEVINLGITATNSYTVNDIAADLVPSQPDLLVVYDGHNEFYGALGASSNETIGSSRWIVKAHLFLIHSRTYQLIEELIREIGSWFRSPIRDAPGTLMERMSRGHFVPYGSPVYVSALDNFKSNLKELRSIAQTLKVRVLLGTQVSNLSDLPPFHSVSFLQPPLRDTLFALIRSAEDASKHHNAANAQRLLDQAFRLDSLYAETSFMLGKCNQNLAKPAEALRAFFRARDYDNLRFRASSDFNAAICAAADSPVIFVTDIEKAFLRESRDSLLGNDLVLEHLHPTLRGDFLIAKEYTEAMKQNHILATPEEWNRVPMIDEDSLWRARPVTDLDERAAHQRIAALTSGWPFRETDTSYVPPEVDTLDHIVAKLLRAEATWEESHVAAAEYYVRRGDSQKAINEYGILMHLLPGNVSSYLRLAQLDLRQDKTEEAERILRQSLSVEETPYALNRLGILSMNKNQLPHALEFFRRAGSVSSDLRDRFESSYYLAVALAREGRKAEALSAVKAALRLNPGSQPAQELYRVLSVR